MSFVIAAPQDRGTVDGNPRAMADSGSTLDSLSLAAVAPNGGAGGAAGTGYVNGNLEEAGGFGAPGADGQSG